MFQILFFISSSASELILRHCIIESVFLTYPDLFYRYLLSLFTQISKANFCHIWNSHTLNYYIFVCALFFAYYYSFISLVLYIFILFFYFIACKYIISFGYSSDMKIFNDHNQIPVHKTFLKTCFWLGLLPLKNLLRKISLLISCIKESNMYFKRFQWLFSQTFIFMMQ